MTLRKSQNNSAIPILAKLEGEYPKIRDTNANQIAGVLNYLIILLNIKTENKEETNQQMLIVGDLLRRKFSDLTTEEIKEAFRMFVAQEFSNIKPFRLLDAISIGEVLYAYKKHKGEKLKIYRAKKQLPQKTKLSEKEKESIVKQGVKRFFDEFKKTGEVKQGCVYVYDFLYKKGEIKPHSEKYKNRIKTQAKINIKQEQANAFWSALKKQQTTKQQITNECKRLALIDYFKAKQNG